MFFYCVCEYVIFLNINVFIFIIYLDIKRRILKLLKVGRRVIGYVLELNLVY